MIIDAHSHYMPPEIAQNTTFFKAGWSDAGRHLSLMDQHGIDKALLLYPTSDAHLKMGGWPKLCEVYNLKISEHIRQHKNRFIGAGIIPADAPNHIPQELNRIKDLGLNVISLASSYDGIFLDDDRFLPVFEFCQKYKMPIHVHAQIINPIGEDRVRDPLLSPVLEYVFDVSISLGKLMMNGVLKKFPDVKIIFAHYGGVLPLVKERFDSTYTMLRKREFVKDIGCLPSEYFKNLYFDTSGSKSAASLLAALEVVDSSHILFGSDYPANQDFKSSLSVLDGIYFQKINKKNILENPAVAALI